MHVWICVSLGTQICCRNLTGLDGFRSYFRSDPIKGQGLSSGQSALKNVRMSHGYKILSEGPLTRARYNAGVQSHAGASQGQPLSLGLMKPNHLGCNALLGWVKSHIMVKRRLR